MFGTNENDQIDGTIGADTLQGLGGNDTLWADSGNDLLEGGDGNDDLFGKSGNDTLLGGSGDDFLRPGSGSDSNDGGSGTDVLMYDLTTETFGIILNATSTTKDGVGANQALKINTNTTDNFANIEAFHGSFGNDIIRLEYGNWVFLRAGADNITIYGYGTHIIPGSGNDTIVGDDKTPSSLSYWNDGYDDLDNTPQSSGITVVFSEAMAGTVTNDGWGGTDVFSGVNEIDGSQLDDHITGGSGSDDLAGDDGDDTIFGGSGHDEIDGQDGNDSLEGGHGEDEIDGGDGNDWLDGGSDDDQLNGEDGNDTLEGRFGNDELRPGAGSDEVDGGEGDDELEYHRHDDDVAQGIFVTFTDQYDGTVIDYAGDIDVFYNIEEVRGTNNDDTIIGIHGEQDLRGDDGDDLISGGDDDDNLQGNVGSDTLNGDSGDDYLQPGSGTDSIDGGAGDGDRIVYKHDDDAATGVVITWTSETSGTALDWAGDTDTFTNIEEARGTDFDDTLTGHDGRQQLQGEGGDDLIQGGDGDDDLNGGDGDDLLHGGDDGDFLEAGAGNDTIQGGEGGDDFDILSYTYGEDASTGITVQWSSSESGTVTDWAGDTDTFSEVERVEGTNLDDVFFGSSATDDARGQGGNDLMQGFEGDDELEGDEGNDTIEGGEGHDWIHGGDDDDSLLGGNGDDDIVGANGDDTIFGGEGRDYIEPGAGTDSIDGGAGTDFLVYLHDEDAQTGVNIIWTGESTGTALDWSGHTDTFTGIEQASGTDFDDILTGMDGNQTLEGEAGNDSLFGGDGDDGLFGGAGDDTLDGGDGEWDFSWYGNSGDGIVLDMVTGIVTSTDMGTDSISNVEAITATNFADSLTGDDANNWFRPDADGGNPGENGADTVDGGGGEDWISYTNSHSAITVDMQAGTIIDADGNTDLILNIEVIAATAYNDTMTGSDGEDQARFYVDYADALIDGTAESFTVTSADGVDVLTGFEILRFNDQEVTVSDIFGTGGITIDGDESDEFLEGTDGDDVINGSGGNDTLYGGAGNDTLTGGTGDDTIVQSGSGTQHYDGGAGIDTYKIDIGFLSEEFNAPIKVDLTTGFSGLLEFPDHALNDTLVNFENIDFGSMVTALELVGDDADNLLHAGSGNDTITGGAGNDHLYGGLGDDYIDAGLGKDTVIGGQGNDEILGGGGSDDLRGKHGADTIQGGYGHDKIFGGNGSDELRGSRGADTIGGGTGNDMIYGGIGHDKLIGSGGQDSLFGNDGNDTLQGGRHNDFLKGGNSADVFVFNTNAGYWGKDYIVDFELGVDRIVIEGFSSEDVIWKDKSADNAVLAIFKNGGKIMFNNLDEDDLNNFADWDFIA